MSGAGFSQVEMRSSLEMIVKIFRQLSRKRNAVFELPALINCEMCFLWTTIT